jgi:tetratricopeptide (TPR) repeat protein
MEVNMRRTAQPALAAIVLCIWGSGVAGQVGGLPPPAASAEHYVAEGDQHLRARELPNAIADYKRAIEIGPDLAAAHHGLSVAYGRLGRQAEALDEIDEAIRLDPRNAVAHLNRGVTLAALRRGDQALREIDEARRLDPQNARLRNDIGNTLTNTLGLVEAALQEYREASHLAPDIPEIHHNIGLMLFRLGRPSEAIAPFEESLRLNPRYQNARFFLADALSRVGRYPESIESWTKFLELVPDGPDATRRRAWDYLLWGQHGEAAAADSRRSLDTVGWRDAAAQYMVLVAHLGNREAGHDAEASLMLGEAAIKCDTRIWPYAVIRYLRGDLSEGALLTLAGTDDQRAEAHTYIGMDLLLKGQREEARAHFLWMQQNGSPRLLEYPLAVSELARLPR